MENQRKLELTALQQLIETIKDKRKESDISNTLLRFCQVLSYNLLKNQRRYFH